MKSFSRNKLKILFLLALCFVFSGAVISCGSIIKLNVNQQKIRDSNEIILRLDKTISAFTNAHTARYKYLKSTNIDYLNVYISAREKVDANIQSLKKLTKDNRQQQQQVFLLEKAIFNQLNIFEKGFYLKQKKQLNLSNKLAPNESIKRLIYSIEKNEKSLLSNRIEISQLSLKKAIIAFLIAGLINLGLVVQFYYLLNNCIIRLKKTESALGKSEKRLRAIIDAEPVSIKLIHRNSNILEINPSGIEMMEVENADTLVGKSIYTAVLPEYQTAYKLMHESVCNGNQETLEFEMIGFKGTRRWMETHAIPLPNENDSGYLHLAITRDITQRKFSEQKLQEQAALLDEVTNAILVKDIQNQILYWNKGAENIYGWSASEVYGKKSSRLLHREYSSQQDDALLSVINVGEWEGELHQITKEGKDIIIQSRWTLLRDEKGRPKYILAENTEVTQKKKLETQLLRIQRLESIGTLAGGIAHDLNNVLTPILMSVQLLERKLQDSQYIQLLKTLENNAQRGASLIKQLLSFARGIEGQKSLIQTKYLIAEIEQVIRETFPKSIK